MYDMGVYVVVMLGRSDPRTLAKNFASSPLEALIVATLLSCADL